MSPSPPGSDSVAAASAVATVGLEPPEVQRIFESLAELAEDASVPRNIRRGAQAARDELTKPRVALDVRIASAVYVLDDLANDPNLPTHGRTAIWSIISNLESLQ
ncbi:MAG TPA: UPF0147 family protein [Thermoplasmata archaeon]|nr:UPF0147 family protein [Thermoplasmata archaeon]